jgi:L-ribulose-5-phosphate 4-epimerase
MTVDRFFVDQVLAAAASVVGSGAISANGHGNVSVRVPGAEEMYYTAASSLKGLGPAGVVRVALDGSLLEGSLPPIQGAVVAMHTAMYLDDPTVGSVIHTHSPFATAFAVARQPIGCWIEALAMFGLADGIPVAAYGPRGSAEAIANIRAAIRPGVPAVLLANHGVLVFHRTPELAVLVGGVVEEAAQAAIAARSLGGPVEIAADLRAAALQRAMAFDATGMRTACGERVTRAVDALAPDTKKAGPREAGAGFAAEIGPGDQARSLALRASYSGIVMAPESRSWPSLASSSAVDTLVAAWFAASALAIIWTSWAVTLGRAMM